MSDLLAGVLYLLGGFFCLVAAAGIMRMPDLFMRMHASTKAGTLGVGLIAAAAIVQTSESGGYIVKALGVIVFMIGTAPVGAHLLGRAAFRSKQSVWEGTLSDDLSAFEEHPNSKPEKPPIN